ncbi:MAG: acyltransferase [Phycisphaerae bacterium]|nr:acyltransferase [Phycisphaerae bacterium]
MRISPIRVLKYCWLYFVMWSTSWMTDLRPVIKLRGFLARPAFKKCGRNLQICHGTDIKYSANMVVGNDVFIASYCWINAVGGLTIEDEVMLGPFVVIATGDHVFKNGSARFAGGARAPVKIEFGSWVGAHAVITRGVTIGRGSLIGANAVVTKDVRSGTVAGGVPAREVSDHVKELESDPDLIGR